MTSLSSQYFACGAFNSFQIFIFIFHQKFNRNFYQKLFINISAKRGGGISYTWQYFSFLEQKKKRGKYNIRVYLVEESSLSTKSGGG